MNVEKELEEKIVTKLTAALSSVSGVRVSGVWQASNEGEIKGMDTAADLAVVAVSTGAPEYDSYATPIASIPVAIGIVIRHELAPTAAALNTVYGPIEDVLVGWQLEPISDGLSDLTSSHFTADGVRLDAGSSPQYEASSATWTISRAFTVRGVINNNE